MRDYRIALVEYGAGLLQLMHPQIGAGVANQSDVFEDVYGRVERSLPLILGVLYDENPEAASRGIVEAHRGTNPGTQPIRGKYKSTYYNALSRDPKLRSSSFWFAHDMIYLYSIEDTCERFYKPEFTDAHREQLFAETLELYRRYGLRMDWAPSDYESALKMRQDAFDHDLQMTDAAKHGLDLLVTGKLGKPLEVKHWMWDHVGASMRARILDIGRITTLGAVPTDVRERFDIPWSDNDQATLDKVEKFVKNAWQVVPVSLRITEQSHAGYTREGLNIRSDRQPKPQSRMLNIGRVTAVGAIPPALRKRYEIPWSEADQTKLRGIRTSVRNAVSFGVL